MRPDTYFNSDSTYCSPYENSRKTSRAKFSTQCKRNEIKFLDKIHNEIVLHWEGIKLISRIQARQYMKQISKMELKSYKDQYFAEKIQLSLLKIYNLTREFERSLSIVQISEMADPIKSCSFTQDLNIFNDDTKNAKQMLLKSTSIHSEKSFPLDILTNNNFVSPDSNFIEICSAQIEEGHNNELKDIQGHPINSEKPLHVNGTNSIELFSSGSTEVYIEKESQFPEPNKWNVSSNKGVDSSKRNVTDISEKLSVDEIVLPQNFRDDYSPNSICSSQLFKSGIYEEHVFKKPSGFISQNEVNKNPLNDPNVASNEQIGSARSVPGHNSDHLIVETNHEFKDLAFVISKIMNTSSEENNCLVKSTNLFTDAEISETKYGDESLSVQNINVHSARKINTETITKLGNSKNKVDWHGIQKQLEHTENVKKTVYNTLDGLFEKLSLEEYGKKMTEYKERTNKRGNFHNFSSEDVQKLDLDSLLKRNESKLEKISQEFKTRIDDHQIIEDNVDSDCEDYDSLDWRTLVK